MAEIELVPIDSIRCDVQTRARTDFQAVDEYAALLNDEAELEPAIVYKDGDVLRLAAGYHRLAAHRKAGKDKMPCEVRIGSRHDALLAGIRDNLRHRGVRLTRADRAHNVRLLLKATEKKMGDREIAELCGVVHGTVGKIRSGMTATGEIDQLQTRVGRDGVERRLPAVKRDDAASGELRKLQASLADSSELDDPILGPVSPPPSDAEMQQFFRDCIGFVGKLRARVCRMEYMGVGISGRIANLTNDIEDLLHRWEASCDEASETSAACAA